MLSFKETKYAIQTSQLNDTVVGFKYTFKVLKSKSKDILSESTKKCEVTKTEDGIVREIIFFNEIRSDLMDAYEGSPRTACPL